MQAMYALMKILIHVKHFRHLQQEIISSDIR